MKVNTILAVGTVVATAFAAPLNNSSSSISNDSQVNQAPGDRPVYAQIDFPSTSPLYLNATPGGRISNDPKWAAAYEKARNIVAQMTIPEKVNLTTGTGWTSGLCVGNTGAIERFQIPELCLQDGPLGVRFADYITAYPAGITAGSSFNKELIALRGEALAKEFKTKGVHIALGPVVGPLGRNALGGRIWESFGFDPYLQGVAARLTTRSIQNAGLIATIKHFIGNEQEHFRQTGEYYGPNNYINESISSDIDDRTLHEVYLWPFADVINEGVGSVMCSYNRINNTYACENSYLMNHILKEELGFEGFVMSDWWAMKAGIPSVEAGLDMAMPGDSFYFGAPSTFLGSHLTQAVLNGTLPDWRLSDMAVRILAAYFYVGLDKNTVGGPNFSSWSPNTYGLTHPITGQSWAVVNKHIDVMHNSLSQNTSLQVATEGIVLLKNTRSTLPLINGTRKPRSINLFGLGVAPGFHGGNCAPDMACSYGALVEGWGSGAVTPSYFVSPFQAITDRALKLGINFDWDFTVSDFGELDLKAPLADVNIIFAVTDSGEGFTSFDGNWGDRNNASLWHNADNVILRAASANANNIVVVSSVGPANLEQWIDHPNITAVLFTTPGGQDAGTAVANVLFGCANPSGKLPFTIARDDNDYIPIVRSAGNGEPQAAFTEGVYIDYKWFTKNNYVPRFEFGYGLSYSNFSAANFRLVFQNPPSEILPAPPALNPVYNLPCNKPADPSVYAFPQGFDQLPRFIYPWLDDVSQAGVAVNATCQNATNAIAQAPPAGGGPGGNPALWDLAYELEFTATNNGPFAGGYAYQLYVQYPQDTKYDIPIHQLRGFEKPYLEVGGSTLLNFSVLRRDLSVWDTVKQTWVVPRGTYTFLLGKSSKEFIASVSVALK